MKKIGIVASCSILLLGCSTRTPSDSVFNEQNPYQTPEFSISDYKSPESRNDSQNNKLSLAIAISGGGHRAGNFGVGILSELENINCSGKKFNALKEVDYFSTVSGGGFAAGVYVSTLYDHLNSEDAGEYSLRGILANESNGIRRNLERGYHNILVRALLSIKSLGPNDRGDFLEKEFDKKLLGYGNRNKSLTFKDIFIPKNSHKTPSLPLWVTNATVYENGSIFPFHPQGIKEYKVTSYTHHIKKQFIDGDIYRMPLSVAMKASASFPGAVPATTLESTYDNKNKYLHLFDGGLSDNLGINSALKMLAETEDNEKVLIVIDAYKGQPEPFSDQEWSPSAIQILLRSTSISLDAWRIRHKLLINQLSSSNAFNGKKVEVIYLSFDDLSEKLKRQVIYIDTNFNINSAQQESLFSAAKEIVSNNKNEIVRAIFGKECADTL
jgi:predicted acylesterase/phospholipase RssA